MKKTALIILTLWAFMGYAQSDKEAQREIAEKYVQALKDKDFATIDNLFDYDGTSKITLDKLGSEKANKNQAKWKSKTIEHFEKAHKKLSDSSHIKLMGQRKASNFSGFMVRLLDKDYNPSYLGLVFEKVNNQWVIVDYYDFVLGKKNTQKIINSFTGFMSAVNNPEYVKKYGDSEKKKVLTLNRLLRARGYDKAKAVYQTLSEDLKNSEPFLHMGFKIAEHNKDENFYSELLSIIDKSHPNSLSFYPYFTDYYFLKKDYSKARKHLSGLIDRVGTDGATITLEIIISFMEGDYQRVLKESHECVARESDFEPCYASWVTSASKMKNYTEVVKAYDTMLENTGGSLTKSLFNEEDGDFVHSEAFKNWDIPEE